MIHPILKNFNFGHSARMRTEHYIAERITLQDEILPQHVHSVAVFERKLSGTQPLANC